MRLAIGIDLGGTNIVGAVVDSAGRQLATLKRPTPAREGPRVVIGVMQEMVAELLSRSPGPVLGIGLGITGTMDREAGISIFSPNFANWRNVDVLTPFRERFGLPVTMDNDVRVGALGELHFGAGRRYRSFLFTAIGTGIGGGIVIDRQIYRGPYGTAGEFGHLPIRPAGGPRCGCGASGCLEALCSGPGIRRRTLEALAQRPDPSSLRALPPEEISARTLAEAARAGDRLALQLWEEIGTDFGLGVTVYYNLLGPEAIIVGGGVSLAGDLLLEPARRVARERLMSPIRDHVELVPAELGDEAGVVGAATLVDGLVMA
ncbi:MAG: ROK family protein [Symbiobacterium sp.]|uniref:ROK family protein n=1 Tax=Symbiobacterium sp. TaxID=1971213 RepID=UPI003463E589